MNKTIEARFLCRAPARPDVVHSVALPASGAELRAVIWDENETTAVVLVLVEGGLTRTVIEPGGYLLSPNGRWARKSEGNWSTGSYESYPSQAVAFNPETQQKSKAPGGTLLSSAVSDDGRLLYYSDHQLAVATPAGSTTVLVREERNSPDPLVAISPDGRLAAFVDWFHRDIRVWTIDSPDNPPRILHDIRVCVHSLAFSPDSSTVLGFGEWDMDGAGEGDDDDDGDMVHLQLWDAESGKSLGTFSPECFDEKPWLEEGAMSPDRRWIIASSDHLGDAMVLFSVEGDVQTYLHSPQLTLFPDAVFELKPHAPFYTVRTSGGVHGFSAGSRYVAVSHYTDSVCFYEAASEQLTARLVFLNGGRDWFIFTPTGLFDGSRGALQNIELLADDRPEPLTLRSSGRSEGLLSRILADDDI